MSKTLSLKAPHREPTSDQPGVKNWRVRCSWGDGHRSYYYFDTEEQTRKFYPEPKPRYGVFSGRVIGYRNPRNVAVQERGPRDGWRTPK